MRDLKGKLSCVEMRWLECVLVRSLFLYGAVSISETVDGILFFSLGKRRLMLLVLMQVTSHKVCC